MMKQNLIIAVSNNMEYRYHLNGLSVVEFLSKMHLAKSKINWIASDHKYDLDGDTLLLDSTLFNEKEVVGIDKDLDVIYQDEAVLVVNKPKGIIIYSEDMDEVTLDRLVGGYLEKKGLPKVARHIYRLDKQTSGLMVYALDPLTLSYLSYLNENRTLEKNYYCICQGLMKEKCGVIDLPIARNRHDAKKMMVYRKGQVAITKYEVLDEKSNLSLLRLGLVTGRTHQIRVHLSYLGHPILGDGLYGTGIDAPLQLEVGDVSFVHPFTSEILTVTLPNRLTLK